MSESGREGSGRETRLLALVIAIAVIVLLVLSRVRFPEGERAPAALMPTSGPLERLAARATFDELARVIGDVAARVRPALVVLQIAPVPPLAKGRAPSAPAPGAARVFVPALRVGPGIVLAHLPEGMKVVAVQGLLATPEIVMRDEKRELVFVRVPAPPGTTIGLTGASDFVSPGYLAVVEGALGGPAVRPMFAARFDPAPSSPWPGPSFVLAVDVPPASGAFAYSLDGRFIGLLIRSGSETTLVPASAIAAASGSLGVRTP